MAKLIPCTNIDLERSCTVHKLALATCTILPKLAQTRNNLHFALAAVGEVDPRGAIVAPQPGQQCNHDQVMMVMVKMMMMSSNVQKDKVHFKYKGDERMMSTQ